MTRDILVDPPLPPVSFGDTVANPHPLRVSRIIWMASKLIHYVCFVTIVLTSFRDSLRENKNNLLNNFKLGWVRFILHLENKTICVSVFIRNIKVKEK